MDVLISMAVMGITLSTLQFSFEVFAFGAASLSALIICQPLPQDNAQTSDHCPSHALFDSSPAQQVLRQISHPWEQTREGTNTSAALNTLKFTRSKAEPSYGAFLAACGMFGVSLLYLNVRREHRYQYHVLAIGGIVGCGLQMLVFGLCQPATENILRYLPISLILAELLNLIIALLLQRPRVSQIGEVCEEYSQVDSKLTA